MITLPDGIVTVHLNGKRYRGAYYYRGQELVVTAYGLQESSADLAVLEGELGKAVVLRFITSNNPKNRDSMSD